MGFAPRTTRVAAVALLASWVNATRTPGLHDEVSLVQHWREQTSSTRGALNALASNTSTRRLSVNTYKQPQDFFLLGVETRDERDTIPLLGARWNIANVGAKQPWEGWLGRVRMYMEVLADVASKDPQKLVVLTDVRDMLYGGCKSAELLQYYRDAVDHSSGAEVVFGAAVYCWPCSEYMPPAYDKLLPRARAVMDAANMSLETYVDDHTYCDPYMDEWQSRGYVYLNAGFTMGPAKKVHETFQGMMELADEWRVKKGDWPEEYDDQWAAATYMLRNPEKVTLDYTGRIVLTEERKLLWCHNNMPWLRIESESKRLVNTVSKATACFVHAVNALGRFAKIGMLQEMRKW